MVSFIVLQIIAKKKKNEKKNDLKISKNICLYETGRADTDTLPVS